MSVTGEQFAAKAAELLGMGEIPYVAGGEGPEGMDCQGLVRWVMRELGMPLPARKGTNYMWRNVLSERGSIADCVLRWGKVPLGVPVFIRDFDGGEKERGYNDSLGNVWHVYIKFAEGRLIHASAGNGRVVVRDFADREISNGGPNAYGLLEGVVYTGSRVPSDLGGPEDGEGVESAGEVHQAQQAYVRVQTANGNGVRAREKASPTAIYKYTVPEGAVLQVMGSRGNYYKVHYLGKARYVDRRFVVPYEMG